MRKALNENPMVQISVLAVVGLILAFMLFSTVLKGEEAPPVDPAVAQANPAATADPAAAIPVPTDSGPTSAPLPAEAPAAAPGAPLGVPADPGDTSGLLPGAGLPSKVIVAFAKGKAIALLVVDPKGISDREVETYTEQLSSREKVEVFVVDVEDIADYSRVTSGVAVSRAPALVVIRPRKLTGNVPTASVSYGFRSPRSVEQALDDALYVGDVVPSYP